jgi:hypothetical protein
MDKEKNKTILGVSLFILGPLAYLLGYPIYAITIDAYGGKWCDLTSMMAIYVGVSGLMICLTGVYILSRKWWLPLLLLPPLSFLGFAYWLFPHSSLEYFLQAKAGKILV